MKTLTTSLIKISIILTIVTVAFAVNYIQAAWSAPQNNPPDGNTPAPINTGSEAQVKEGALSVDGLVSHSNNNIFVGAGEQEFYVKPGFKGEVQTSGYTTIGTSSGTVYTPNDFEVGGQVRASQYCDENGANCLSGGGSSGENGVLGGGWPVFFVCETRSDFKSLFILLKMNPSTVVYGTFNVSQADRTSTWHSYVYFNKLDRNPTGSGDYAPPSCAKNMDTLISEGKAIFN